MSKKIQSALVSVYSKEGLEPLVRLLHQNDVKLYSTGGTQTYLEDLGIPVTAVETLTGYPSIFGGRVKTLHPVVFGGILYRRDDDVPYIYIPQDQFYHIVSTQNKKLFELKPYA